ncbi:MAG: hypothetical protein LUQ21_01335, partial [Methanothrix sp.]|nr:hypothetical protein [Methanothrix sp.]
LQGILIGGPSPTKEEFMEGGFLHHELQHKVLGALDVSYTDESGLYELVDAAQDQLLELELTQDKVVMRRFMKELVSEKGLAAYGESEVRHNLELGGGGPAALGGPAKDQDQNRMHQQELRLLRGADPHQCIFTTGKLP